jgi:hypothetical protein
MAAEETDSSGEKLVSRIGLPALRASWRAGKKRSAMTISARAFQQNKY